MWLLAVVLVLPFVASLTARGPPAVLQLQTARTSAAHPLHASDEVTLWCAPDNLQITIRRAWFVRKRDKKRYEAQLSANKKNATLTIPSATVADAGEYTCELDTQQGRLTTQVHLYARPVAITDHDHFTVKGTNEFHLEGERQYIRRGSDVNITCPVFGYPTPGIKWTKDGKPLELSDKVTLEGIAVRITEADYPHAGLYTCEAINEYTASGKTSKPLIIIEKMLDVKSELAWIYPLAVIIIILVLLAIVIGLCEFRKRRQYRQSRYITQE
ncbi:Immunoglobulin domain protein [Trichostrongylus colubriformis]|uniref:Immunoglobulin domain protein n=1 Tax=Trichostrongylus colubriformis TaxID=6319 RepID=A0AAN8FA06_TRICO